jgi:hypothetical protein
VYLLHNDGIIPANIENIICNGSQRSRAAMYPYNSTEPSSTGVLANFTEKICKMGCAICLMQQQRLQDSHWLPCPAAAVPKLLRHSCGEIIMSHFNTLPLPPANYGNQITSCGTREEKIQILSNVISSNTSMSASPEKIKMGKTKGDLVPNRGE